jgi:hypothetical protein
MAGGAMLFKKVTEVTLTAAPFIFRPLVLLFRGPWGVRSL